MIKDYLDSAMNYNKGKFPRVSLLFFLKNGFQLTTISKDIRQCLKTFLLLLLQLRKCVLRWQEPEMMFNIL